MAKTTTKKTAAKKITTKKTEVKNAATQKVAAKKRSSVLIGGAKTAKIGFIWGFNVISDQDYTAVPTRQQCDVLEREHHDLIIDAINEALGLAELPEGFKIAMVNTYHQKDPPYAADPNTGHVVSRNFKKAGSDVSTSPMKANADKAPTTDTLLTELNSLSAVNVRKFAKEVGVESAGKKVDVIQRIIDNS